ncbi:protein kinase [Kocuria sp.]|uniref:protein kinase domain-containing protein n=1 Tax=Kocuria sp. TaxID=1871328 RepID=UPI0026DBE351|nr:protein kinase [Kocuria sp.]MDO4919964.1 protein kinase [Kocuria sp.]
MNDPRTGTLLDNRYLVGRRIARGGTAAVYEALDERLDRPVALKIMHPHVAEDPAFAARAQREARSAARLHHPNVVSVLDQGQAEDGALYLVLEYVDGPTLREVIARDAPLSPRRTLDLLVPVLRGLARAHGTGLVHRDVKPENVLLTSDGQVKVADFGLTRAVDDHTATATVLGTVGYAAPELVGDGPVDQRSDVYAVGIMTYEMLTGSRPYTGTALQVANAHVSRDVPAPSGAIPGVPPALDEFVLRATARDAARRPADAAALLDLALAIRRSLPEPTDLTSPGEAPTEALGSVADRAPTETLGAFGGSGPTEALTGSGSEPPTEALGAAQDAPTETLGSRHDAPTEALGPHDGAWTATRAVPVSASRGSGAPGSADSRGAGGPGAPSDGDRRILPRWDADATSTLATATVGSTAHRSPGAPRVRLNPPARPLHVGVALVVFALLLTVAGFLGWWLGSAPGSASATVPAVAGQDTAAAERTLHDAGITNVGVRTTTSTAAPEGVVLATDPAEATTVRGIEQVNLVVSSGPARVDVPSLTGAALDAAQATAADAGLRTGTVTREYSTQPESTVLRQSPAAGTEVDEGSAVDLTVAASTPQEAAPAVVGRDADDARAELEGKGFTVRIDEPLGSHLNRVVRQRTDGTTVTLTVL